VDVVVIWESKMRIIKGKCEGQRSPKVCFMMMCVTASLFAHVERAKNSEFSVHEHSLLTPRVPKFEENSWKGYVLRTYAV
jgi:hypothetical protein